MDGLAKHCAPTAIVLSSWDDQEREPGSTSAEEAAPFPGLNTGRGPAVKETIFAEG
jgi:hypothetical protein